MDRRKEAIVRGIMSFVGLVLEIDKFSLASGMMRSATVCVSFDLSQALILGAWMPFNSTHVGEIQI